MDIGSARLRAALAAGNGDSARVEAVATRAMPSGGSVEGVIEEPELIASLLDEVVHELRARTRDCVLSVGPPAATLRPLLVPKMSARERREAGRIDAERRLGRAIADVVVRVQGRDASGTCFVGVANARALHSRVDSVRRAGLRAQGVDYDGLALRRALPIADAVVDVGSARTTLHASLRGEPLTLGTAYGGDAITRCIADDLGIDVTLAERRKHEVGLAGAGETAFREAVREVADLVRQARRRGCIVDSVALSGNGSRIAGYRGALERDAEVRVCIGRPVGLCDAYPDDVAIAASCDWALALGLARWARP